MEPIYQLLRHIHHLYCLSTSSNVMTIVFETRTRTNNVILIMSTRAHVALVTLFDPICTKNINSVEGYNNLRQKFGTDSFWVNGPYHAIMTAINGPGGEGSYFNFNIFNTNPESSTLANLYLRCSTPFTRYNGNPIMH